MVTRESVAETRRTSFSAILESTCVDYVDPTCWRLAEFAIADRAVNISVRETANGPSTPGSPSGGATKESSEFDEAVILPSPEAPSAAPVTALLPAQEGVMPPAAEANLTPFLEILVAGVDVEASVLRADGESAVAFEKNLAWLTQRVLKKLKYDPGPPDGTLGPRTVSAIRSYQRDHDLTADGRPSRELLHHMKDELRRMAGVDVEASVLRADGESALAFEKNLAWLTQRVLKKLKYDPGPLDGKLGSRTVSAIRSYQRDHDLTAHGRPSRELLHHMKDELRNMNQQHG